MESKIKEEKEVIRIFEKGKKDEPEERKNSCGLRVVRVSEFDEYRL